jgi:RNA polymerase sigma-70 factor (ECF subfamily)
MDAVVYNANPFRAASPKDAARDSSRPRRPAGPPPGRAGTAARPRPGRPQPRPGARFADAGDGCLPNLSAARLVFQSECAVSARTTETPMTDYTAARPTEFSGGSDPTSELLTAVGRGDASAFERLYRETSSRLFGVCLRLLPERSEAEDVLQEVYATVWRKAGQFDASRASAITWLAMIARNKAIDRLRAAPSSLKRAPIELIDEIADSAPSPSAQVESADENERLRLCMEELDARRRQLIRTAFFDGATYEELAQRSGSPLGSIKSWIRRGLIQLRACLER